MKVAVKSLLTLLDISTGFCYWLLGGNLLKEEIKRIQESFIKVKQLEDELILIQELNNLSPGKDLLLICNAQSYNLVQWCILNNYIHSLTLLLQYGCNPARTGLLGFDLPLTLACCFNRVDMIQLLLDHGASPFESTELSSTTLRGLSQDENKERYLKIIDMITNGNHITSLSVVLKLDDLEMFRLLMRETLLSPTISSSLSSSVSCNHMSQTIDNLSSKICDKEFDMFRDKLKAENYVKKIMPHDKDEYMEHQQNVVNNDDLSDYVEQEPILCLYETLDVETTPVSHCNCRQALSENYTPIERVNDEELCAAGATTDGGYFTVDGSSGRIKLQPLVESVDREKIPRMSDDENLKNIPIIEIEQRSSSENKNEVLSRVRSQQQLTQLSSTNHTIHRRSLPTNIYQYVRKQSSGRARSTPSFSFLNIPHSTKHTANLLRLLHQMIEHEAVTILEYFLKTHRNEFNDHFHATVRNADIELKTYELLSNVKSSKIYDILLSSNCAYFNKLTTNLCDRENNTLVHLLLGQNPLKYEPTEMIKMVKRYMTYGLNEFVNRPNLSNHCMIQILLCNENFLKMIFFPRTFQSSSTHINSIKESMTTPLPIYEPEIVEKWRQSYLILIEILIKNGARIDISSGSYRNSLDCLLSTLLDLAKRLSSIVMTTFDIKYLKRLIIILLSSFNQTKTRVNYFKYNIERFIQLLYCIHIHSDDLSDILSIIHILLRYEYHPLRLNRNTLAHLFKLWITNPNFLCSSLIGKDLFMQQLLIIIVRRFNLSTQKSNESNENLLLLSATTRLQRTSSITLNDNDITLQSLLSILLNLLPITQTCLQVHSIYELIVIFINHTAVDVVNSFDQTHLPIVYLCLQTKMVHSCLLIPFIDLFANIHSIATVQKTKDILLQIPMKRLSFHLYKHFLEMNESIQSACSLRHISSKYIYDHLKKPFIDSVNSLSIVDSLKERLIHFDDI